MIKSHYASKHGSMQKVLLYKPNPKKKSHFDFSFHVIPGRGSPISSER